jgi:RNA polymerase sigma factor (sigma-70 family)
MATRKLDDSSKRELANLLRRAQMRHDRSAVNQIIAALWRDCYNLALSRVCDRQAAQDITRQAFLDFANQYGQIRNPEVLRSWIYRVILRKVHRYLKKRGKLQKRELLVPTDVLEALLHQESPDKSPLDLVCEAEELAKIRALLPKAVERLSPRLRQAYELVDIGGCSVNAAATAMKASVSAVCHYRSRAHAAIVLYIQWRIRK